MDFLRGEPIFGLKNREPEPDPGGPRGRVCPYVRMSILVPLDRNIDNQFGILIRNLAGIQSGICLEFNVISINPEAGYLLV